MMNGTCDMMGFMGGGMLLVALILIAIGVAIGYVAARRRHKPSH